MSAPVDHLGWFYEERSHLIAQVAEFAAEGLRAGDQVILIATDDHARGIRDDLALSGIDTTQLQILSAADVLAGLMRDGEVNAEAFDDTIGDLIRSTAAHGPLRAFGEMVALLWDDGKVPGAIELEALWCGLRETQNFSLLCAYPSGAPDDGDHVPVNAVCALHSEIRLGEAGEATTSMRLYPATPEAVGEARRFVRACLGESGPGVEDALLATSELCSNAVRHARSPFAVHISLVGDTLRVSVRDGSDAEPRLMPMAGDSETGRGIATVASVSRRWGIDHHRVGKTVWAELAL